MDFFRKNLDELARLEQEAPQQIGFLWSLLRFLFIVLLILMVGFVGLRFGYTPFLKSQIKKQEAAITELTTRIPQSEQDNLLKFYFQLADLEKLLRNHVMTSKVFALLESRTNQRAYFTSLSLDVGEKKLALEGIAPSYEVVAQQLASFEAASDVASAALTEAQTEREGRVRFGITLVLAPRVFAP